MANQDSPESGVIIKLLPAILAALLGIIPSCDNIARHTRHRPKDVFRRPPNTSLDDIAITYRDNLPIIIPRTNSDDIVKLTDDIIITKQQNLLGSNKNNIARSANGTVVVKNVNDFAKIVITILPDTTVIIRNSDDILIIPDKIGLRKVYLDELDSGRSTLISRNTISYEDLDAARRLAIQKAANQAAQNAVRQALSEDINHESLKALAELAAQNAVLQKISKQIGYSAIVIVSTVQMGAIVNQSIDKALEENNSNKV